ncbi:MAG: HEPN domain-containing protein [Clostridia bacterium]|nr:HEPN domain-containing protein [Clostridia bacterium]MDY5553874.1 HEPN domain-containing protein [Blautia sp.]
MNQPDSLDVGTKMDVVRHRLNVAREDLDTAYLTFKAGKYRAANNRAYYSIFHTICAVLAKEGVAFKRHKDTLSYFNKNYVQPEIFPRELGRKIVKAEEIRHASDYDTFYIASKEITAQQIETATKILELAEQYLLVEEKQQDEE